MTKRQLYFSRIDRQRIKFGMYHTMEARVTLYEIRIKMFDVIFWRRLECSWKWAKIIRWEQGEAEGLQGYYLVFESISLGGDQNGYKNYDYFATSTNSLQYFRDPLRNNRFGVDTLSNLQSKVFHCYERIRIAATLVTLDTTKICSFPQRTSDAQILEQAYVNEQARSKLRVPFDI